MSKAVVVSRCLQVLCIVRLKCLLGVGFMAVLYQLEKLGMRQDSNT